MFEFSIRYVISEGEPLATASGGNLARGEVNRKGVISPVESHDH